MSDLIDRQAAIDVATSATMEWDGMYVQDLNVRIREAIEQLPPVNNSEMPNSSDVISREAARDALEDAEDAFGYLTKDWREVLEQLPPIQPVNCSEFPNNSDTISRKAATDALRAMQTYKLFAGDDMLLIDQAGAQTELMLLPPAEPKKGKWNRLDRDTFNCNKCGATFVLNQGSEKMHFCPNCLADMREVTT